MFLTVKRLFLTSEDIMGVMLILNVFNFLWSYIQHQYQQNTKYKIYLMGIKTYIQDNYLISTITNKNKIFTFPANTEIIEDCNVENNDQGENTGVGIEMVTLS